MNLGVFCVPHCRNYRCQKSRDKNKIEQRKGITDIEKRAFFWLKEISLDHSNSGGGQKSRQYDAQHADFSVDLNRPVVVEPRLNDQDDVPGCSGDSVEMPMQGSLGEP